MLALAAAASAERACPGRPFPRARLWPRPSGNSSQNGVSGLAAGKTPNKRCVAKLKNSCPCS
eukprot:2024816-Lingulodinium_polyedra.AAC.1